LGHDAQFDAHHVGEVAGYEISVRAFGEKLD